ncbi:MAG: NAD(+) synthase [Elusimicrobia bacterium]|nr:NAD(+) synthase [Elusimicrobiota bacterium]
MKLIRLATAALNQTPLDWSGNLRRCLEAVEQARAAGVSILCLPELALSGYGCEDAFHMAAVQRAAWRSLETLAAATEGMAVGVGLPVFHGGALFDAAALLVDGKLEGLVPKQNLAGDGLHYEPRWFKAWPAGARVLHEGVPMGDLLLVVGGVGVGFEVCEDAWVPARPGGSLSRRGADILLNPSASHFAFGKQETRRRFVAEGSRAFGVAYAYANLLGNEAGRVIYDGALLVATAGAVAAEGERFSSEEGTLVWADVDVEVNRMLRAKTASFKPELGGEGTVSVPFDWPALAASKAAAPALAAWERSPRLKEEEFTRAVSLGLRDYLRKSGCSGFVVSLSGGADSSATAALAALALGPERRKDGLLTVFQGTEHSSPATRASARTVAAELGATHVEWEVDDLVAGFTKRAEKALGRTLTWDDDDITLQNIQARVRAPGPWLLANARNALLLCTSDRSEAAVGYATMDGDTAGGLAPIAGIDKAFLLRWLEWMGTTGPEGLGAIPALASVAKLKPSPELKPGQTSEGDLMPYPVLDAIERAFVRDKRGPEETAAVVAVEFPECDSERLRTWVGKFYRLWCRNQWKRERYAPSFHLDDESLDPRGWFRFPILSAGFTAAP